MQSYIPAKSLEEWLKSGRRFSEEEVKQLAKALLEILCYLHEQQPQVVHRDIKPSNILLGDRSGNSVGQVYLVDFGSVQTLAANRGSTITVVGTYGYMPPEQFGGRTVPASDLYSLGATLIYLVTGRHPAELSQDNLQIQFESAANLSSELSDWLKWMTEPSLNRRLKSAGEALKALEHPCQRTGLSTVGQKPFGSRIKLKQNGENIEILIPPARLSSGIVISRVMRDTNAGIMTLMGFIFFIVGCLPVFGVIGYIIQGKFTVLEAIQGLTSLLFWTPIWGVASLFLIYGSGVPAIFVETIRLHLDPKQISWTNEWPWRKYQKDFIRKNNIQKLVYKQGYWQTTKTRTSRNKSGTNTRFIPATITIYSAGNEYEFSVYHLTEPEMDWIARELSEWSSVPITFEAK